MTEVLRPPMAGEGVWGSELFPRKILAKLATLERRNFLPPSMASAFSTLSLIVEIFLEPRRSFAAASEAKLVEDEERLFWSFAEEGPNIFAALLTLLTQKRQKTKCKNHKTKILDLSSNDAIYDSENDWNLIGPRILIAL